MSRRTKKDKLSRRASVSRIALKDRKKRKLAQTRQGLGTLLKIILLVGGLSAVSIGFVILDQYVRETKNLDEQTAALELINPPVWVSEQLKQKIYAAARAGGEDLRLDDNVGASVQKNIESHVAWLDGIQIQVTNDSLRISGDWKRPVASFEAGIEQFLICSDYFVLDYVPVPALPIVNITGISFRKAPSAGSICKQDDIAAAVELIGRFAKMDEMVASEKPLLFDIESIDVSNFNGRDDKSQPHIILYAKDGTQVIWGAELGNWQKYLEATDKDKIANLYEYYHQHGTIMGGAKFINLQYPQSGVPQPIDNF